MTLRSDTAAAARKAMPRTPTPAPTLAPATGLGLFAPLTRSPSPVQQAPSPAPSPRQVPLPLPNFMRGQPELTTLRCDSDGTFQFDHDAMRRYLSLTPTAAERNAFMAWLLAPITPRVHLQAEAQELLWASLTGAEDVRLVRGLLTLLGVDPLTRWVVLHPLDRSRAIVPPTFGVDDRHDTRILWGPLPVDILTQPLWHGQREGGGWITLHGQQGANEAAPQKWSTVAVGHCPANFAGPDVMPTGAWGGSSTTRLRAHLFLRRQARMPLLERPTILPGHRGRILRTATADYLIPPLLAAGSDDVVPMVAWYKRRGQPAEPFAPSDRPPWVP